MKPIVEDNETLDWYAATPKDFFDGTGFYTFEVKAAYRLVLDLIYASPRCQLPDKSQDIAKRLGMTTNAWNKARAQLVQDRKLFALDGMLTNRRATAYWRENMPKIAENRAKIAEKRAKKTPEKQGEKQPSFLPPQSAQEVTPPQNGKKPPYARARESESEIEEERKKTTSGPSQVQAIIQVELIATTLGQKRGPYWERDYRRMLEDGLTPDDILEAAKAHRGDPIRSLNALKGLATAKRKAREERDPPLPPMPKAPVFPRKTWEVELTKLLRRGGWDRFTYGPPPTREGHHVPPDLHAQWKKLWELQGSHPMEEFDYSGNLVPYPADWPSEMSRSFWEPNHVDQ